ASPVPPAPPPPRPAGLADYAYFNHSAHVNKGVGCVTCHGRVDKMGGAGTDDSIAGVYQVQNLSMGWCLECHREPEKYLRPLDKITDMDYSPLDNSRVIAAIAAGDVDEGDEHGAQLWLGTKLKEEYEINNPAYMQSCSTCHR
ncbi:MAG: cytochrome c3 family protein, partial [Planctomycetota bacterium]